MTVFKIKKGSHYATPLWARLCPFSSKYLVGYVTFGESCFTAVEEIPGWNKLTGVSSYRIHNNSARFVWRAMDDGTINVAGYVYTNGARFIQELITVTPKDPLIIVTLEYKHGNWVFKADSKSVVIPARKPRGQWFKCFPFFGGQSTAPHDINIKIELV